MKVREEESEVVVVDEPVVVDVPVVVGLELA